MPAFLWPKINCSRPKYAKSISGFNPENPVEIRKSEGGDSGAPLLIESNNSLKLVGIAWYRTTLSDEVTPYSTGFSPVGDYKNEMDAYLNLHSLPYQPLPPQDFTASRISDTQINLTWTDISAVETAYVLERATSEAGPWTSISTGLAENATTYEDFTAPTGDVFYRLLARNDSDSAWVLSSALTPYSLWAAQFEWGTADQSPVADANGDGIANLVAYSMNLSPLDPLPANALPSLESPDGFLDFFYRKNPDATDLSFTLKKTPQLNPPDWQTLTINGLTVTETDMGEIDSARLIRVRIDRSTLGSTLFLRLEIVSSDPP